MSILATAMYLAAGLLVVQAGADLAWLQDNAETLLFLQHLHQEAMADASSSWHQISTSDDYPKRLAALRSTLTGTQSKGVVIPLGFFQVPFQGTSGLF